jgi:tetratricopeptide (TPR) repeat protein
MIHIARACVALLPILQLAAGQNETGAWMLHARRLLEEKRITEASQILQRILRADPSNSEANYNLGVIAMLQRRPADALSRFEAVLHRSPKDVPALTGKLESQLMLKRREAARSTARTLASIAGPSDPVYYQTAALLATNGEYREAIPMLEKVRQRAPDSYEVNYNLALAYAAATRLDDAARVIAPFETNAEAADLRGAIEQKRGDSMKALQAYRRAVDLDPRNENYRADFGSALLAAGQAEDAVKLFRSGLVESPESWRLRLGLGSSLYVAGRYEDAAAALIEAVQRRPDASIIYVLLAKSYESAPALQPQIADAIESYVRRQPKDAFVYLAYGDLLYAKRDLVGARRAYENALSLDSQLGQAHLQLGLILQEEGKLQRAIIEFQSAIKASPKLGAAHYRLGLAYQRLGRTREAEAEMTIFRELKTRAGDETGQIVQSLTQP